MPVRARGDEDGFNVAAGQQIAQVAVHGAILVAVFSVGLLFDGLPARGLHVANGDEPQVRFLQETAQVVSAPVADADCAQDNAFAGGDTAVPAQDGPANQLRRRQQDAHLDGSLQELPPIERKCGFNWGGFPVGQAFGSGGSHRFHLRSFSGQGTDYSMLRF